MFWVVYLKKEKMEARTGIEPVIELLQSPALPLGYPALGSAECILPQKKVNCVTPRQVSCENARDPWAWKFPSA